MIIIHLTSTQARRPRIESLNSFSSYVYTWCTRAGHYFCDFWCIGILLNLYCMNTLGRAVEQLAGCLAKTVEVKVQQTGNASVKGWICYEYLIRWRNRFKQGELSESRYYCDAEAQPTNVGHLEVSCFFADFWMSLALAIHWPLSSFYSLFLTGDQSGP